jgi:hypothetical protein
MKILMLAVIAAACVTPQAAPPKLDKGDMHRFLFFAVYEGLWEDGFETGSLSPVLKNVEEHFVTKCHICNAVRQAIRAYAFAPKDQLQNEGKGTNPPKEVADGLKSEKREERLKAIQLLVDRYVARRFDRVKMTDDERRQMKSILDDERKRGMSAKGSGFGDFCPSCDGATGAKPKK